MVEIKVDQEAVKEAKIKGEEKTKSTCKTIITVALKIIKSKHRKEVVGSVDEKKKGGLSIENEGRSNRSNRSPVL